MSSFISTRVIANSGGSFVRSVMVDAGKVTVATPDFAHSDIILRALAAGKHVIRFTDPASSAQRDLQTITITDGEALKVVEQ